MPELLRRQGPGWERVSIYAGWFDIANVVAPWNQTLNLTKFAALFYESILVPDGFFHCYGPLFDELIKYSSSARKLPPPQEMHRFPLLHLLQRGVVVPAIRRGESIYETWNQEQAGVIPGRYLNVRRRDGAKILQLVDATAKYYVPWPDSLAPKNARRRSRFASEVQRIFLSEESPYCVSSAASLPKNLPSWMIAKELVAAERIVRGFEDLLRDADGTPSFRRGDVEQYIAKSLSVSFRSYRDIVTLVDWQVPYRTLAASYAYYLLSVATSAYEFMQAAEFECVAGLFPLHDNPLIEEQQLYRALVSVSAGPVTPSQRPLVVGSLDVSKLSVSRILAFRRTDPFVRYCELLRATKNPKAAESFWDANHEFVEYLRCTYLPAILKEFPSASAIAPPVSAVAAMTSLATAVTALDAETLEVGGIPVFRILALVSGALNVAAWVPRISDYILAKKRRQSFERNNYALWRTKSDPATNPVTRVHR